MTKRPRGSRSNDTVIKGLLLPGKRASVLPLHQALPWSYLGASGYSRIFRSRFTSIVFVHVPGELDTLLNIWRNSSSRSTLIKEYHRSWRSKLLFAYAPLAETCTLSRLTACPARTLYHWGLGFETPHCDRDLHPCSSFNLYPRAIQYGYYNASVTIWVIPT